MQTFSFYYRTACRSIKLRRAFSERSVSTDHFLRRNTRDNVLEVECHQFPKPFRIDFASSKIQKRLKVAKSELVAQATRKMPLVIDFTAGLGRDAIVLAGSGSNVFLFERNPHIHALLADALFRLHQSNSSLASKLFLFPEPVDTTNIELTHSIVKSILNINSSDNLSSSKWPTGAKVYSQSKSFAIYLDPMYPIDAADRRAKSRKETQILHILTQSSQPEGINGDDGAKKEYDEQMRRDEISLFRSATSLQSIGASLIAVKRGKYDRVLYTNTDENVEGSGNKSSYSSTETVLPCSSLHGSTQRFDLYTL